MVEIHRVERHAIGVLTVKRNVEYHSGNWFPMGGVVVGKWIRDREDGLMVWVLFMMGIMMVVFALAVLLTSSNEDGEK